MIRLSKKTEYALRALVEVGCQSSQHQTLSISQISKLTSIPLKFLEQILLSLKKSGILKSKRGVEGGYCLERPLDQISLAEVVSLFEGPLCQWSCIEKNRPQGCSCPHPETCSIRLTFQSMIPTLKNALETRKISDVVEEVQFIRSQSQQETHYVI